MNVPSVFLDALEGVRAIELNEPGFFAIVDQADYERAAPFSWGMASRRSAHYATARVEGTMVYLHRYLLGLGADHPYIDHVNGYGLDNRRCNLRLANTQQNARNARKTIRPRTSRFKGVSGRRGTWRAYLGISGRFIHLGSFVNEEDAARAYDAAALQHFGGFARLNFPAGESIPAALANVAQEIGR